MLHYKFQHISLIFKWVWFQNNINFCSKRTMFYYFLNCIYGFTTVVLIHRHRDLGLYISNGYLKWKCCHITRDMGIVLGVNTWWHKHIFGDIFIICKIDKFFFKLVLSSYGCVSAYFILLTRRCLLSTEVEIIFSEKWWINNWKMYI